MFMHIQGVWQCDIEGMKSIPLCSFCSLHPQTILNALCNVYISMGSGDLDSSQFTDQQVHLGTFCLTHLAVNTGYQFNYSRPSSYMSMPVAVVPFSADKGYGVMTCTSDLMVPFVSAAVKLSSWTIPIGAHHFSRVGSCDITWPGLGHCSTRVKGHPINMPVQCRSGIPLWVSQIQFH